jgi:UDPglucose--hexose-1-phosphate uridylyltransferase
MPKPNEIRRDFFGREVIVASSRSKRPGAFRQKKSSQRQVCPFCPGNEKMTAKTTLSLPDEKNWQVRMFPNKFPVLEGDAFRKTFSEKFPLTTGKPSSISIPMYQKFTPFGRHEIMVETRDHYKEYESMDVGNLELALIALKKRYENLMAIDGINYVTIFKNKGEAAGASISHTHTQIVASPLFPEAISKKMDESEAFYKEAKECGMCVITKEEAQDQKRVILNNRHWLCIAPFTSVWPYQVRILPKRHFSELSEMDYSELQSLAKTFKELFTLFAGNFDDMPYNMVYMNFPRSELWHFHIDIFPRLVTHAGFEFFGLNVNVMSPEEAASRLRKVAEKKTQKAKASRKKS